MIAVRLKSVGVGRKVSVVPSPQGSRLRLSLRISFNLFIFSRFAAKDSSSPGDTPRRPVTTPRKCSPCSGIGAHVAPESVLTMVRRPQTVSVYSFNREQHDKFVQGEDLDP
jgi:hypothetical protein